jgi:hypothetical protein
VVRATSRAVDIELTSKYLGAQAKVINPYCTEFEKQKKAANWPLFFC